MQLNADALHDLVGPMNQMRSMADLLLKKHRGKLDDETEALLGFIQAASDRLQNLVAGLRSHTRIVGQHQPARMFDANAILAGAIATIQPAIEQNRCPGDPRSSPRSVRRSHPDFLRLRQPDRKLHQVPKRTTTPEST